MNSEWTPFVTPAQAGVRESRGAWIPAYAGMTEGGGAAVQKAQAGHFVVEFSRYWDMIMMGVLWWNS